MRRTTLFLLSGAVFFVFGIRPVADAPQGTDTNPAAPEEVTESQQAARVILPGDKLSVRLTEDASYGGIFMVSENGLVTLPLLNEVPAAGLAPEALAKGIQEKLEQNYYRQATVLVKIYERNPRLFPYERGEGDTGAAASPLQVVGRVRVTGQVARQGWVNIVRGERLTAGDAIVACGGFSDFANQRKVKVFRIGKDGKKQTIVVDIAAVLREGAIEKDVELKNGDSVVVPQSFFNF